MMQFYLGRCAVRLTVTALEKYETNL